MKSRTIVKNVAQNSGGRSVKVLFFSVQYDCCNHLKKVFRIFLLICCCFLSLSLFVPSFLWKLVLFAKVLLFEMLVMEGKTRFVE